MCVRRLARTYVANLTNTELTDLFSAPRQLGEVPLNTLTNEPVLFEPFGVHAFAVVKNSDCGTLVVEVGGKEDGCTATDFLDSRVSVFMRPV